MGFIDIVILTIVIAIVGGITFFSFYKNKDKDKCKGCPYKSKCQKDKCDINTQKIDENL